MKAQALIASLGKSEQVRRMAAIALVSMICGAFVLIPNPMNPVSHAKATDQYYATACASATNGTYWKWYWESSYAYGPYSTNGIIAQSDDAWLYHGTNPYTRVACHLYAETDNFTNPNYYALDFWNGTAPLWSGIYKDDPIPDNGTATVTNVAGFAIVSEQFMNIDTRFYFSVDDKASWIWQPTEYSKGLLDSENNTYILAYNLTDLADWTPSMLNTTSYNTHCGLFADLNALTFYGVDYVGLAYIYSVDWAEWGEWEDLIDPPLDTPGLSFGVEAIVPMMGLIGFIGMIAMPAMGFMAFRNGDENRVVIFGKILVAFMFCLTMFLVSIAA